MVTIDPSLRKTTYNPVTPTTAFQVNFPLFDNDDLKVVINDEVRTDFTVSATYVDGVTTNALVNMSSGVTGSVIIYGDRTPARTDQFATGGPLPISNFNYALNRLEVENQEARRDIDQSASDIAQEIIDRETAEDALIARLDSLIGTVEAYADAAAESADESESSANDSQASATEAAMYAAMLNTAVYDFNFDSDPALPGYDWNT
jgi:hypothetical protein